MPFVHSLVRTAKGRKQGWCAPAELGEDSPHYVSFAIPMKDRNEFFSSYTCEAVSVRGLEKVISQYDLSARGHDAFLLRIGNHELWFVIKPIAKSQSRLPYIGKLEHPDFAFHFVEIEPEDPDQVDRLFESDKTFIMGCDPFTHYLGIKSKGNVALSR